MKRLLLLSALVVLSSCATMVNGRFQQVPVESYPSGAHVQVFCGDAPADGGVTPTKIRVARGAEHCSITLTREGYVDERVDFERQLSAATKLNRIPGVALGVVGAIAAVVLTGDVIDPDDAGAAGYAGGSTLGAAPGRAIDRATGGAYKQVPQKLFVTLLRAEHAEK